jgi:chitodextrinase
VIRQLLILAATGATLAGCASTPKQAPAATPVRSGVVMVPQVMASQGLRDIIGSPPDQLTRRFGNPRIDLAEGDARKLQFAGSSCVLDIYLYPLRVGAVPTATHVEARMRQGGAAVDAGTCIREVEGR